MSRFTRSRGAVSRVASALLFACAALAVVVFPEGEAGGISAKFGFRPAQVPVEDLGVASAEYDNPLLCTDLGGKIENSTAGENICSEIDLNDTFCVVGADEAFPCRGLFKHVLLCNVEYSRPALNPFFCGARCDAATEKARGPRCERFFPADDILPEAARTITVMGLTEGMIGPIATLQAAEELTGQERTDYGVFEIVNHRPADHADSNGLTIAVEGEDRVLEIHADHRLREGELTRTVVAKSFCSVKEGIGENAKEKCYPTLLTLAVEFRNTTPRVDIPLASVVAEAERNISVAVAAGYSGPGHQISLVDAGAYDLTAHQYDAAAHGYDAANDIIVIDIEKPIDPSQNPLIAAVTADVVCLGQDALCRDAKLTVTAIFYPIDWATQAPVNILYKSFAGADYSLPAQFVNNNNNDRAVDGTALAPVGVNGYAGDFTALGIELNINNNGFPALAFDSLNAPTALPVGEYTLTAGLTHETMLGTIFADIPLEVRPAIPRESEYGLLGTSPREIDITVVGDYADKIFEVAYSGRRQDGSEPGLLLLPETQPDGLVLGLSEDGLALTVYPAVPVRAGASLAAVASVTVTVNRNYEFLAQPLTVRVSALSQPDAAAVNGPAPYAVRGIATLGVGAYADAVFGKESGSANLEVDAAGRISVVTEIANAGVHNIVVTATSSGFLGVARFEAELNVEVAGDVPSDLSIPTPARKLFRAIGSGYAGTVAFFAAASDGVTLATGDDGDLEGFSFVTDSGASAANGEHVSPDGFYLSVDARHLASAGEVSVAAFEVTAKRAGSADTSIALDVTVSVISSPAQIPLNTNTTADFEHSLILPAGYEYGASLVGQRAGSERSSGS